MIAPSLPLGIGFHAAGGLLAANCYVPQRWIKRWSWEIFWMTQAAWCWLLWPIIGAMATIPNLRMVLADAPREAMLFSFLMGMFYGVGGTAFNMSIRYIGFSLTYCIAVGLSSVLGTLVPPLVRGQFGAIMAGAGGGWVLGGVAMGAVGIAVCGFAGRLKEQDLEAGAAGRGTFSMMKGMLLSLLAGVLSAVYGFSLDAATPVVALAEKYGAGIWKGNIAYLFANSGAFVTVLVYTFWLARRNKTLGEFRRLAPGEEPASLRRNYMLAVLTGTLWYGQFFFYNLGHVRLGPAYAFSSWAIHMIMLVLISNGLGVVLKEWRGCRPLTLAAIIGGLAILCCAVSMLGYGNYLGERPA